MQAPFRYRVTRAWFVWLSLMGAVTLLVLTAAPRPATTFAQTFSATPSYTNTLVPTFTDIPSTATAIPSGFIIVSTGGATATLTNCIPAQDFKIGDIVVLIAGISIRSEPNPDSALLAQFPDRREFTILGGPVCRDGFNFFNIHGHGLTGWVAEGRIRDYWLYLVRRGDAPAIPCLAPLDLVSGERFQINTGVRIRAEPNLQSLTRTVVPSDGSVVILEGPVCAEGYNWWKVQSVVVGVLYEGWMAEANRYGGAYIAEATPDPGSICHYPLNFTIGDHLRIIYDDHIPKRLRAAPDTSATILYELIEGVPMVVVGGPVCNDTYNWWQVQLFDSSGIIGWVAEGGPAQYWLARNLLPGRGQ